MPATWEPLAAAMEALNGDDDVVALFDEDDRHVLLEARARYRDGKTPDAEISALLATIRDRRPIRLH